MGDRPGVAVEVEIGPGVTDLLWRMGEDALTVELTVDFENDVFKSAVAFPGASDASLGFEAVKVDGVTVWWRQRFVLAEGLPRVTSDIRPRRLVVGCVGRALSARADYC